MYNCYSSTTNSGSISSDVNPMADISLMKISDFYTKESTKGSGLKIAIIDSGCNINHPDLAGKIAGVRNFSLDDGGVSSNVTDYNGQGTAMAGVIASSAANYPGVAPGVQLYILKATGISIGNNVTFRNAVIYAINLNVDIIVTGMIFSAYIAELDTLTDSAVRQNTAVVSATSVNGDGNATTDEVAYPAAFNHVIGVGMADTSFFPSSISGSNNQIDIMAIGQNVSTLDKGGGYVTYSGTAYSAAYVAGAYALIKKYLQTSYGRSISYREVYANLIKRTLDTGSNYKVQGAGLLYMTADTRLRVYEFGS